MESVDTVESQKAAYDTVIGTMVIIVRDIQGWISAYGKWKGKTTRIAVLLVERLVHVNRCGDVQ